MYIRRPGRLLNVLCTFNLRPLSTGKSCSLIKVIKEMQYLYKKSLPNYLFYIFAS